jgi:hypothetical protein
MKKQIFEACLHLKPNSISSSIFMVNVRIRQSIFLRWLVAQISIKIKALVLSPEEYLQS